MFHPKPAIFQLPESEVEMSWSENTTPDYDDIEEIIRTAPSRLSVPADSRIRIMREPIKKRRRIDEVPRGSWQGRVFHEFAQPLNVRCSMDGSDGSNSSALTIITSASSSVGDPWSASGHVEEEGEEGGADWDQDGEDGEGERDGEEEEESFVLPKIEPIDDDTVDMGDVKEASIPDSPEQPRQLKRPRGRPRKHPKPTPESLAKVAKGRSKTGCITCRRRKKKCDEAKPRCMNCEKNNVRCEGYPDRKIWQSGKEKAEEEGTISTKQYWACQQDAEELIASTARMRRVSLPTIKLQSLIHGVDTDGDRLFFRHYIYRLSSIFTLEGERKNAFKDMILPLAIRNQGLMHSILALAGRHINYRSSYGVQLLKDHPTVKESELEERSDFHKQEAMKLFLSDCDRQQRGEDQGDDIVSARFGQMICMVMDTLSNPDPRGDHRLHLQAYQRLIKERPPADGEFLNFIREFFDYHISMDDLIFLPSPTALEFSIEAIDEEDSFESLETEIPGPSSGVRMLGVCDGLFHLMSHITKMRNTIRDNIRKGIDPPVVYSHLWKGAELDIAIRRWEPAMTPDHASYPAALMYKQMAWVYLWRTIYPPIPGSSTPPNSKIKVAVDQGLEILKTFGANDPSQTLLLGPIFMLGCASFEECQRKEIRKAISVVKTYMQYRNSDSALEVLEEMWRRMDKGDASSWDWQRVSREMGRDFLAT